MRIERLNKCCGSRGNLSAVDFQPHSQHNNIHRIATSGGTYVQIWAIAKSEDKLYTLPAKCVPLFTFKDHSPYDVTTVRWSPNGEYLASTDSGGITNILRRNEQKTELMERLIKSKLSGEPTEIPDSYSETTQVTKYTIKYDGTDKTKRNNTGISRISLTSKNVQVESKEVKSDNLNLLDYNNPDGNLECWEPLATLSCPNNMGQLFDISWAPDNRSIIGGGMNGHVIVFDIHTKEIVAKFDALENTADSSSGRGYIKSVSWDPMTLFVAVQSSNKEISIWRRSPPLPPGSPMKWTFKRVLHHVQFSETSSYDVLGGSRISWAPNGKTVVFPNSSINSHNFSTCYQVSHNTASFAHAFNRANYNKNQVQYYYDVNEHSIEMEPLLLRGHTSRIRNVRFSSDIMKSNHTDPQSEEKYFLLAQSSDDNMLSVWRFRVMFNAVVNVECVCVIKNFLDEQSSIEDLSWGDFGKCLAVASSQGGLILIHFSNEDIGAKFHTNRMLGLNLRDMSQPSADLFHYSEQVNDVKDDSKSSSERADSEMNNSSDGASRYGISQSCSSNSRLQGKNVRSTMASNTHNDTCTNTNADNHTHTNAYTMSTNNNNTQGNTNSGSISPISSNNIAITNQMYKRTVTTFYQGDKNVVLIITLIVHLTKLFVVVCYRIYIVLIFYKLKFYHKTVLSSRRPSLSRYPVDCSSIYFFYLFNFTMESENRINSNRRRVKGSKKQKISAQITQELIEEVWLDMDYGSQNTLLNQYWKDSDYIPEITQKEVEQPEIKVESPRNDESGEILKSKGADVGAVRSEKSMRGSKGSRAERSRSTKSGQHSSLSMFNKDESNYLGEALFSYPTLRNSISLTVGTKRVLGVNFTNSATSLKSSVCYFEDATFKIDWVRYMKRGYITHMECLDDTVLVLNQSFEGENKNYLSVLTVNEGFPLIDQLELDFSNVSVFNAFKYTHTYFFFVTTALIIVLVRYDRPHTITHLVNLDLGSGARENILKIEVLNTSRNCVISLNEKLMAYLHRSTTKDNGLKPQTEGVNGGQESATHHDRSSVKVKETISDELYSNVEDSIAFLVYKKNKIISIYSQGYEEIEVNVDNFEFTNNTLATEHSVNFTLESLFRLYQSGFNTDLFGKVDFDGSLSSVMDSFGIDYNGAPPKIEEGVLEDPFSGSDTSDRIQSLQLKLKACVVIGSGWEYLLYLHEYVKLMLLSKNLIDVIELTEELYKCIIKTMNEVQDSSSSKNTNLLPVNVHDVSKYQQLFPHCLGFLRCVVVPSLIMLYREFNPESQDGSTSSPPQFDDLSKLCERFGYYRDFVPEFMTKIIPSFDYPDDDRSNLFQKLLHLLKNVQIWENILKI